MDYSFKILDKEKQYLIELAKKQAEYASLPVMEERKKLWYAHNSLRSEKPPVVMEVGTFENDFLPALKCETSAARDIERVLLLNILNHELIDDDKVVPDFFPVFWRISHKLFGLDIRTVHALDRSGRDLGFKIQYPIKDLKQDFSLLGNSEYKVDREGSLAWKEFVEDVIGHILRVELKNSSLYWFATPTAKIVYLMGLENMMFSMYDYPEEFHCLMGRIREDILAYVAWQEKEGLLTLNNANDYSGAGSYGFTDELPAKDFNGHVRPQDLWLNMNSQESVGISPEMYSEFIHPYYCDIASRFGLVYYGCCEPVHSIWENCLSKLPGLRKISVSPWCDEEYMGNALKGTEVIYSRKPSPNFIGVGSFEEEAFASHIRKTLHFAKGNTLEFIFRDIYSLTGDVFKPGKAVAIVRKLIEENW